MTSNWKWHSKKRTVTPKNPELKTITGLQTYKGRWHRVDKNCQEYLVSLINRGLELEILSKIYDVNKTTLTMWYEKYMGVKYLRDTH
jgi:hypothetical protein